MNLLEYEAKEILRNYAIPVPKSFIVNDKPIFLPAVIKSQVPTGGRGKAGGIIVVKNIDEYPGAIDKLKSLEIKGFKPKTLLAEEVLSIAKEFYISLVINKSSASIELMGNQLGGVEIEENTKDSYWKVSIGISRENKKEQFDEIGQQLADYFYLPDKTFMLQDLVEKLYNCFVNNDALLLEINPLIFTTDGDLVAGDCKMELDDATTWRHIDWDFETKTIESNFVTLDRTGTVATIANGAGLAMATVDAVADAGLQPANFLDIGGGANEESILEAFKRINDFQNVKVIIVNIYAGITRCNDVARAIISAQKQLPDLPKLAVRLAGTNYNEAVDILRQESVTVCSSLHEAILTAKSEIQQ